MQREILVREKYNELRRKLEELDGGKIMIDETKVSRIMILLLRITIIILFLVAFLKLFLR